MNSENQRYKELADFLKTRRAKTLPSQVGMATDARRRTPGLRREEVAQLAGIGLTWYTWLEQGRPIQVSAQIMESLSRVLMLDKQERNHLYLLANLPLPADIPECIDTVSPILQHVLDSMVYSPSMIMNQRWNVIAWNEAADIIFGDFNKMNSLERNIVWAMFIDKKYKQMYTEWSSYAKDLLSRFRATCGQYIEDPWLINFVEELKKQSEEFRLWWPLHEIQSKVGISKQLKYPGAGILDFEVSKYEVSDNSGLTMIVHTPTPGTDTAEIMSSLLQKQKAAKK